MLPYYRKQNGKIDIRQENKTIIYCLLANMLVARRIKFSHKKRIADRRERRVQINETINIAMRSSETGFRYPGQSGLQSLRYINCVRIDSSNIGKDLQQSFDA